MNRKLRQIVHVMNTSNPASTAARSRTPLRKPSHRCARTVVASWPVSSGARCRGRHWSTRSRTRRHRFSRDFQSRHSLASRYVWKGIEENLERVTRLQIVEEIPKRHSSSGEYRLTCENLRIGADDFGLGEHRSQVYSLVPRFRHELAWVPTCQRAGLAAGIRARAAALKDLLSIRHQIAKLLLRYGHRYRDGRAWTQQFWSWLRAQYLPTWLPARRGDHRCLCPRT